MNPVMEPIQMSEVELRKKCIAIVMFGPATPTSGMRAAEYYQVTIDPALRSPSGKYIRFGLNTGDHLHGWQRVESLTICEILAEWEDDRPPPEVIEALTKGGVTMRIIE